LNKTLAIIREEMALCPALNIRRGGREKGSGLFEKRNGGGTPPQYKI
jgi:hypothetical protein